MIDRRFPVLHFALEPALVVVLQVAVTFRGESRIPVVNMGTSPFRTRTVQLDAKLRDDVPRIDPEIGVL